MPLRVGLCSETVAALGKTLQANGQSKTGTKPVLIARYIENETYGALPRCTRCKGGLYYAVRMRAAGNKQIAPRGGGEGSSEESVLIIVARLSVCHWVVRFPLT
jgi:hypothetical protein